MRAIIMIRLKKGGVFPMIKKKELKMKFLRAVFGCFLVMMGILGGAANLAVESAYADPVNNSETTGVEETTNDNTTVDDESEAEEETNGEDDSKDTKDGCRASMKPIGWLVCPVIEKVADAADWLYDKIEGILAIDPVSMENGSPIYEVWKYCRGITNIVFIIFLLVVIYSQITGYGITNYGIKKALPKLIISAVMVNLSFLICLLMVDVSNIVGNSLRGLFASIAEAATFSGDGLDISFGNIFGALAGGGALAVGAGVVAFELGSIWMLIPVLLGALVAVVSGLITIALRQAVVMLLIMISPLAFVAYILPNTDKWFKKWKDLFFKMLVFYPMFSLLFGASNLAGTAIIASAQNMFGVLLGLAVQIFPLFFCWSLMKMSGTFLGDINTRLRGLAARPLATNRAWAESHRQLTRQRNLTERKPYTPSLRLMQFMDKRKVARDLAIGEAMEDSKNRGARYYYHDQRYRRNGTSSRKALRDAARIGRNLENEAVVINENANMEKGLSIIAANKDVKGRAMKRMEAIDKHNTDMADKLFASKQRAELIDYQNAYWRHKRFEDAMNVHMDDRHGERSTYRMHDMTNQERVDARERYTMLNEIAEGDVQGVQYIMGGGTKNFETQAKLTGEKLQKFYDYTPPTKDIQYRLEELIRSSGNPALNIDSILPGLRVLNVRGDTDMVGDYIKEITNSEEGLELGTYASQAMAKFLTMEVKGKDPFLRRFGKYINLETAQAFNKNLRKKATIDYNEYIKGYYIDEDGVKQVRKRAGVALMSGTSLDDAERTSFQSFRDSLRDAYTNSDGTIDIEGMIAKSKEYDNVLATAINSASLKFPSGSDQLRALVGFRTGWLSKAKNGVYTPVPIWVDDEKLAPYADEVEKYYRHSTKQFILSQTPSQILALRSDYRDALISHLASAYKEREVEEMSAEEQETWHNYMNKVSEIQTRYGDLPREEAEEKRAADMKKLNKEMAGIEMRSLLDSSGKLAQIYKSRNMGVANNSKDWARELLGLDDEAAIKKYLRENERVHDSTRRRRESDHEGDPEAYTRTVEYADSVINAINNIFNNTASGNVEEFYNRTLEKVKENYGEDSEIYKWYQKYYRERRFAGINDLKDYLVGLIAGSIDE